MTDGKQRRVSMGGKTNGLIILMRKTKPDHMCPQADPLHSGGCRA